MPTLSIDSLPLLLALLVPGFVWAQVHSILQLDRRPDRETWLGTFTLSAINCGLWFWLIPTLWSSTMAGVRTGVGPGISVALGWFIVTFASPAGLGVLSGYLARRSWLRQQIVDRLGLNVPIGVGSAWDYVFGEATVLWAVVTLVDGSVVEGVFGQRSLASSRPGERDLYLEAYYRTEEGRLVLAENSAGIWVPAHQIKAIELRRPIVD
ncbi:MAG: hypothetical protein IBJ11_05260 [Phycisphaerales bacterium]|nr:hypothetical protein [Phycisphaerales bacterium]